VAALARGIGFRAVRLDLRRLRPAELLALPAGLLALVAPFLPWFEVAGARQSAWSSAPLPATLATLAALAALALVAATALQRSPAIPLACAVLATLLGLLATVVVIVYALALPSGASGRCYAVWLGLAGVLAVLIAAWLSMRDERPFRGVPVTQ
jgi:hypothetical protein